MTFNIKKIFTKEFWNIDEIKNQFVHFSIACLVSTIIYIIFNNFIIAVSCGFATGLGVEIKQTIHNRKIKPEDQLRDLFFWLLGALYFVFVRSF